MIQKRILLIEWPSTTPENVLKNWQEIKVKVKESNLKTGENMYFVY